MPVRSNHIVSVLAAHVGRSLAVLSSTATVMVMLNEHVTQKSCYVILHENPFARATPSVVVCLSFVGDPTVSSPGVYRHSM